MTPPDVEAIIQKAKNNVLRRVRTQALDKAAADLTAKTIEIEDTKKRQKFEAQLPDLLEIAREDHRQRFRKLGDLFSQMPHVLALFEQFRDRCYPDSKLIFAEGYSLKLFPIPQRVQHRDLILPVIKEGNITRAFAITALAFEPSPFFPRRYMHWGKPKTPSLKMGWLNLQNQEELEPMNKYWLGATEDYQYMTQQEQLHRVTPNGVRLNYDSKGSLPLRLDDPLLVDAGRDRQKTPLIDYHKYTRLHGDVQGYFLPKIQGILEEGLWRIASEVKTDQSVNE